MGELEKGEQIHKGVHPIYRTGPSVKPKGFMEIPYPSRLTTYVKGVQSLRNQGTTQTTRPFRISRVIRFTGFPT